MDLDKLEALAKDATPGPWTAHPNLLIGGTAVYPPGEELGVGQEVADFTLDANAAYIGAVDPQTVLQLIAELRRAREALLERPSRDAGDEALLDLMDGQ